jgi:hypothetical protein
LTRTPIRLDVSQRVCCLALSSSPLSANTNLSLSCRLVEVGGI